MANRELKQFIDQTPLIDTHEHIIEEQIRLQGPGHWRHPCDDFAYLLFHYSQHDLVSAGMSAEHLKQLFGTDLSPQEKWRLVGPYYERTRHTGYMQAVRIAVQELYGEDDLSEATVEPITRKLRASVKRGFYRSIFEKAGIVSAQVNSLDNPIFCETADPDILLQDLSFFQLAYGLDLSLAGSANTEATSLKRWLDFIDHCFTTYGPRAVAVKNQAAYLRRLDYAPDVPESDAAAVFDRFVKARAEKHAKPWQASTEFLPADALKPLHDFLFHHCVRRATEWKLPIKLHCGYYAGNNNMPLTRLRNNAGDLYETLAANPDAKFVLMHIGYPYQDEYIALAKQFANVHVDLCWAWILNPLASVRFVKEALVAVPVNKLFLFGGDYITIEPTVGHARIARNGLGQALSELVDEGWIASAAATDTARRVMHDNAVELYRLEGREC